MVHAAIPGEGEEFRRLFDSHRDAVFRILYRLAGNRHDAEDLLQETFTRLWHKRDQFRGDGSLEGYLRRIAFRTYLNARPRLVRGRAPRSMNEVEPMDPRDNPADRASREDLQRYLLRRVRAVVDELPESWRQPFLLFRFEGLSCREIAGVMSISTKAVELRVSKALKRVAERLKDLRAEHGGSRPAKRGAS